MRNLLHQFVTYFFYWGSAIGAIAVACVIALVIVKASERLADTAPAVEDETDVDHVIAEQQRYDALLAEQAAVAEAQRIVFHQERFVAARDFDRVSDAEIRRIFADDIYQWDHDYEDDRQKRTFRRVNKQLGMERVVYRGDER